MTRRMIPWFDDSGHDDDDQFDNEYDGPFPQPMGDGWPSQTSRGEARRTFVVVVAEHTCIHL